MWGTGKDEWETQPESAEGAQAVLFPLEFPDPTI